MAVRIRLARFGRIHRPFYRIGAFDAHMRRNGPALEYLGYYDPLETTGQRVKLKKERIEHWISEGASPSQTVASFLRKEGIAWNKAERNRDRNKARATKRPQKTKTKAKAKSKAKAKA